MKAYFLIVLMVVTGLVSGCRHSSDQDHLKTMVVKPTTFTKTLYFAGTIQPLTKTPVIAPVAGTITHTFYQYGYPVKKGDRLCMLESSKQLEAYQTALTEYLKNQQTLNTSEAKLKSNRLLYEKELIPADDYHQSETEYAGNRLSYMQSKDKFESILKQYQLKQLPNLSLMNFKAIEESLKLKNRIREIPIAAPVDGVAFYDKSAKGSLGNTVQEGDVIMYIGDFSGITVPIQASEINIDQLKSNQTAIVTTVSATPINLIGRVKSFDLQAVGEETLPTFPAIIEVPVLSDAVQKMVHMGTQVKVAIPIQYHDKMVIPLQAVVRKGNQEAHVQVINPVTHRIQDVTISTGDTTENSVVVTNGLIGGEEIVVNK